MHRAVMEDCAFGVGISGLSGGLSALLVLACAGARSARKQRLRDRSVGSLQLSGRDAAGLGRRAPARPRPQASSETTFQNVLAPRHARFVMAAPLAEAAQRPPPRHCYTAALAAGVAPERFQTIDAAQQRCAQLGDECWGVYDAGAHACAPRFEE